MDRLAWFLIFMLAYVVCTLSLGYVIKYVLRLPPEEALVAFGRWLVFYALVLVSVYAFLVLEHAMGAYIAGSLALGLGAILSDHAQGIFPNRRWLIRLGAWAGQGAVLLSGVQVAFHPFS